MSALAACGGGLQANDEREKERTIGAGSPLEDGGANAEAASPASADAAQHVSNERFDAAIQISGATCSSREAIESCIPSVGLGPSGPDLAALISTCAKEVDETDRSPCMWIRANVDGMGCVTDLLIEASTNKEAVLRCLADAVAVRRWPCAEEGTHPFVYRCTLEK